MTTTRVRFRKDDLYYDGIAWGTPVGQIVFKWDGDVLRVFKDGVFLVVAFEKDIDHLLSWLNKQIKKVVE